MFAFSWGCCIPWCSCPATFDDLWRLHRGALKVSRMCWILGFCTDKGCNGQNVQWLLIGDKVSDLPNWDYSVLLHHWNKILTKLREISPLEIMFIGAINEFWYPIDSGWKPVCFALFPHPIFVVGKFVAIFEPGCYVLVFWKFFWGQGWWDHEWVQLLKCESDKFPILKLYGVGGKLFWDYGVFV